MNVYLYSLIFIKIQVSATTISQLHYEPISVYIIYSQNRIVKHELFLIY